ncbi:Transcription factor opdL [Exophiala dermatitidis]|uniref:Transcription factor domain-containing protein n=1 Tax=Exophiala dermatitidis (strain ATCC 34100 / CBS 525.76 / NIH/UT8656) TaxID=858893 RepID=H6C524_EXODN|nr:uncharacterized protein HMPREF1120_06927 [Exophiala dermatitidis NIH/UT8656]EHY58925.1 hypothetical protein HMPREF1120_06927 [Exophiala dermatitidis NIH/UT8656]
MVNRCHRLRKECTTPAPVPRKRTREKPTRVAQLEERLNSLTDLLAKAGASSDLLSSTSTSLPTPSVSSSHEDNNSTEGRPVFPNAPSAEPHRSIFQTLAPMAEERIFSDFRTDMSQYFPFVAIPPSQTIAEIRRAKPFLFRACLTVACHGDLHLQRQMAHELSKQLGDCMLVRGDKSLDLLQGILILVAWGQYYNHHTAQLMNLLHLGSALILDLGLNKAAQTENSSATGGFIDIHQLIHGRAAADGARTTDERRAVLGVYYLTSRLSSCNPMRWTPYLEECCNFLARTVEYPTDIDAVHVVRLQRIVERYSPATGALSLCGQVPIRSYVRCLEEDFEVLQRTAPVKVKENNFVEMHRQSVMVGLYEPVLTMDCDEPLQRAEALHACVEHIRRVHESFAALSPRSLPSLPLLALIDLIYAHTMLAKLSFLVTDGWDVHYLRSSSMSFSTMSDRLIAQMQSAAQFQLSQGRQSKGVGGCFLLYAERTRGFKNWYENRLKTEAEAHLSSISDNNASFSAYYLPMEGFFDGFEYLMGQNLPEDWNSDLPVYT